MRYLPVDIGLPFSVAAFCRAKKCNPCLRSVLLLYLGTVKTRGSSRCCLVRPRREMICLKCSKVYKAGIGGPMKPISD